MGNTAIHLRLPFATGSAAYSGEPDGTMSLPNGLAARLRLPVIGAPLFTISNPAMVLAQCEAGIVGAFPALNARPAEMLDEWLHQITGELAAFDRAHPDRPSAPFAVNQIVHKSNPRLLHDLESCVKYKVPIVITSLGAREDVNAAVHSYGGIVLHDITNQVHAHKAIEKGADGLIAVAAGAGDHAGTLSPFALVQELRTWWDGPIALSGSIATGRAVLAAQAMGADVAYIGSAFIATKEANASDNYKRSIVESAAEDIVYTNLFTGVHGNYLRSSIERAGFDPAHLPQSDPSKMDFGAAEGGARAWKDIWGSGQGIGAIGDVLDIATFVDRLAAEYAAACADLADRSNYYTRRITAVPLR
ncbi:MAG: nitronate monooxygenase family protein [Candidatus Velthaea sp.]